MTTSGARNMTSASGVMKPAGQVAFEEKATTSPLEAVFQNMSLWTWMAPVGGGANAEGDPRSGRYQLKKSVLAKLKLDAIKQAVTDEKLIPHLEELQKQIAVEEEKINFRKMNKDIAIQNTLIKENRVFRRLKKLDEEIAFLESDLAAQPKNAKKIEKLRAKKVKIDASAEGKDLARRIEDVDGLKNLRREILIPLENLEEEFNNTLPQASEATLKNLKAIDALKNTLVFFKKETDVTKNMAEVFAGTFSRMMCSDALFAKVYFATQDGEPDLKKDNTYVASVGIAGFEDLYLDAYSAYNVNPKYEAFRANFGFMGVPTARPKNAGSLNKHPMHDIVSTGRYLGLDLFYVMALLLDDPDIHYANIGAVPLEENQGANAETKHRELAKMRGARIDYAASLAGRIRKFDNKIHFEDVMRYFPGLEPTNHGKEYATALRISKPFVEQIDALVAKDPARVQEIIEACVAMLDRYYSLSDLRKFANKVGLSHVAIYKNETTDKSRLKEELKRFFQYRIKNRLTGKHSLQQLSFDIKLSLSFARKTGQGKDGLKLATLKAADAEYYNLLQLIYDHPAQFGSEASFNFQGRMTKYFAEELNEIIRHVVQHFRVLQNLLESKESTASNSTEDYSKNLTSSADLKDEIDAIKAEYRKVAPFLMPHDASSPFAQMNQSLKTKIGELKAASIANGISVAELNHIKFTAQKLKLALINLREACQATTAKMSLASRVYNDEAKYDSAITAFFGWPKEITAKSLAVFVLKLTYKLPLNILKLGTELIPASLAKAARRVRDFCLDYFKDPHQDWYVALPVGAIAAVGLVVSTILWAVLKTAHQLSRRVTSPGKGFHDSLNWGKQYGNAFGYACAAASVVVSIVGGVALSILLPPFCINASHRAVIPTP